MLYPMGGTPIILDSHPKLQCTVDHYADNITKLIQCWQTLHGGSFLSNPIVSSYDRLFRGQLFIIFPSRSVSS